MAADADVAALLNHAHATPAVTRVAIRGVVDLLVARSASLSDATKILRRCLSRGAPSAAVGETCAATGRLVESGAFGADELVG